MFNSRLRVLVVIAILFGSISLRAQLGVDNYGSVCKVEYSNAFDCAGQFIGMYDTASGTFNVPGGVNGDYPVISKMDVHTLLYPPNTTGVNTFLAVHYQPWFDICNGEVWDPDLGWYVENYYFPIGPERPDSQHSPPTPGHYSECHGHVEDGHFGNGNWNRANNQMRDIYERGFNGVVIDWYGEHHPLENNTTEAIRDLISDTTFPYDDPWCTGFMQCKLLLALADDQGSWTCRATQESDCPVHTCWRKATTDQTQCVIDKINADLDYARDNYFNKGNPLTPVNAYLRVDPATMRPSATNGRPVVFFFIDQTAWCSGNPCTPNVDWVTVWTQVGNHVATYPVIGGQLNEPLLIFRNASGFNTTNFPPTDGAFAWPAPKGAKCFTTNNLPPNYDQANDPLGLCTLQNFYKTAVANSSKQAWGAVWKGFDNSEAPWIWRNNTTPKIYRQRCGTTWLDTWAQIRNSYSIDNQIPFVQVATWNDYDEGTEIESGIDNCWQVSASVVGGNTLQWTVSVRTSFGDNAFGPLPIEPDAANYASEATITYYSVRADGVEKSQVFPSRCSSPPCGTITYSVPISSLGLTPGPHTLGVKARGKPSIINQYSNGVSYTQP
jgi:hypothetical protein